ncbi:MAG: PCRF domain-containing protein, partial [Planctomycetia bacterium]|nr:PCRF domain-containing protein [Planctomycetia bacterium]
MRKMLDEKLNRFEELERMMADPAVQVDSNRMAAVAREHGSLAKLATKYRTFQKLRDEIAELREMAESDDKEERQMANEELAKLEEKNERLWNELLEATIGGEDANRTRCVMEIRGGTGGDEAALFARNLFEMYKKHAERKGWKMQILDSSMTELGGCKEISLAFEGECVFRELQYESGGHRVQRVPETEAKGRIHTSAATVAVLPEPEDVEIDLHPDDYEVQRYAASAGPGGQHVNKTASAVRLFHHESGLI